MEPWEGPGTFTSPYTFSGSSEGALESLSVNSSLIWLISALFFMRMCEGPWIVVS